MWLILLIVSIASFILFFVSVYSDSPYFDSDTISGISFVIGLVALILTVVAIFNSQPVKKPKYEQVTETLYRKVE